MLIEMANIFQRWSTLFIAVAILSKFAYAIL